MNAAGHMLVARIAWDSLTKEAQKRVLQLVSDPNNPLSQQPTTAIDMDPFTAAAYMDDIRPTLSDLHFVDQVIDSRGQLVRGDSRAENGMTFCQKNIALLNNPSTGQDQRAEALRYTMHLLGDLHQPVHCGSMATTARPDGDHEGNDFHIQYGSKYHSLHALWDEAAGEFADIPRPMNAEGQAALSALAHSIESQYPKSHFTVGQLTDLNPQNWVGDCLKLLVTDVYQGIKEGDVPDAAYRAKAQADMNSQAALAGYRLAAILNHAFAA